MTRDWAWLPNFPTNFHTVSYGVTGNMAPYCREQPTQQKAAGSAGFRVHPAKTHLSCGQVALESDNQSPIKLMPIGRTLWCKDCESGPTCWAGGMCRLSASPRRAQSRQIPGQTLQCQLRAHCVGHLPFAFSYKRVTLDSQEAPRRAARIDGNAHKLACRLHVASQAGPHCCQNDK